MSSNCQTVADVTQRTLTFTPTITPATASALAHVSATAFDLTFDTTTASFCAHASSARVLARKIPAKRYLIIVKDVHAAHAHFGFYEKVDKKFKEAADNVNLNPRLRRTMKGSPIRDGFRKLLPKFEKEDMRVRMGSGTGEEIGELDKLLFKINEAIKSVKNVRRAEKKP